ncbi:MAG: hypothetical protein ACI4AM_04885 [Muribaculaceae bacterium]
MTAKNLLEQLQGLLHRLEDEAPYTYLDDLYDASDDDFDEDEGLDYTDSWDDEPKRSIPFFSGGILGLNLVAGAAASSGIFPDRDEEEDDYGELNRKSRAELMQIIKQVKAAAERNETITPEFLSRLLRRKFVSPCRELPVLTINARNELFLQTDEVVIDLTPQRRAFYLLFLLNPDGIRITNLQRYRRQFTEIYRIMATHSDFLRPVKSLFDDDDSKHRNFRSMVSNINRELGRVFVDIEMMETFKIANVGNGLFRVRLPKGHLLMPQTDKWRTVSQM